MLLSQCSMLQFRSHRVSSLPFMSTSFHVFCHIWVLCGNMQNNRVWKWTDNFSFEGNEPFMFLISKKTITKKSPTIFFPLLSLMLMVSAKMFICYSSFLFVSSEYSAVLTFHSFQVLIHVLSIIIQWEKKKDGVKQNHTWSPDPQRILLPPLHRPPPICLSHLPP